MLLTKALRARAIGHLLRDFAFKKRLGGFQVLPRLLSKRDSKSMTASDSTSVNKSVVLVVSPLNALIIDQISKLREKGVKAAILKIKEGGFANFVMGS